MREEKDIIVFAGPSGVGKSTLVKFLVKNFDQFMFSVSATTRAIRQGDVPGKDYYFLSNDNFKKKIEAGDFIEYEEVYPGVFYGTLKSEIDKIIKLGRKVILDIDVLGALNLRKIYGEKVYIVFIKTESINSLKKRLKYRNSETEEQLKVRINRFKKELVLEDSFDETIINKTGDLKSSEKHVSDIVNFYFTNANN